MELLDLIRKDVSAEVGAARRYALVLTGAMDHAEDLVQEALTQAIASAHTWNPTKSLTPWLLTILPRPPTTPPTPLQRTSEVALGRVTVFGGSGFLGRQIVRCLVAGGTEVRVAVRHPERVSSRVAAGKPGQVTTIYADVWNQASVGPALEGSDAVVNTIGHYVERRTATFEAIHGHGAMHVARAAALAGVQRLVHISGIGADAASVSTYVRARAIGERLVREQFPQATILRPSVLFGPDDLFLNRLAAMARVMPIVPLFGSGETRLQPVYVGDVAKAVAKVLTTTSAKGQVYELGGPRIYTYKALVQLVLTQIDRRRLLLPVPYFAWELLATLMSPMPKRPISRDQVILMKQDNVVDPQVATFADLGIAPTSIEEIMPTYLGRRPDEPGA